MGQVTCMEAPHAIHWTQRICNQHPGGSSMDLICKGVWVIVCQDMTQGPRFPEEHCIVTRWLLLFTQSARLFCRKLHANTNAHVQPRSSLKCLDFPPQKHICHTIYIRTHYTHTHTHTPYTPHIQTLCSCASQWFSSEQLRGRGPREWQFDLQRMRGRSGHGGATYTGSPCPSAPLLLSEGVASSGHLGSESRRNLTKWNFSKLGSTKKKRYKNNSNDSSLLPSYFVVLLPWRSLMMILLSYEPVRRWWAPGEKRTERMSLPWGRYVWTMRPPLMSYNMQVLSSWPVASRRPLRQLRSLCETEWWWWDVYCDWLQRICFFLYLECRDVTHLSRAELCPPPGHSWGPAGPKTWLSCPESQRRSSILPTCTESECDLFKQNGELYYTGVMQFQAFLYRNICVDNLPCLQTDFKTL